MAAWQGAQAWLPTKSEPKAPDKANKTKKNRHSILRYDIANAEFYSGATSGSFAFFNQILECGFAHLERIARHHSQDE